ncbi:THAP domain-containing protein 1-like [Myzus persicae]|uniref:THAP domain-containing protein 1-like n=1 Tax=Myzus persicae TaxID=13164 RepID=UPI000B936492|nr:THAP domain-containing protein 1-like [Myzus persicae]
MVVSCSDYGCSNRYIKGQPIHFFKWNNILLDKWVNASKRKNFKPTQWSRVCSEHFTEEDYVHRPDSDRPLLKIDSVPSIFKTFPSYLQPKPIKIRKLPAQRNQLRIDEPILEPICEPILEPVEPICGSNGSIAENLAENSNYCDKEVQTSDSYTSELKLKRKIKYLHQKLRRTQKK